MVGCIKKKISSETVSSILDGTKISRAQSVRVLLVPTSLVRTLPPCQMLLWVSEEGGTISAIKGELLKAGVLSQICLLYLLLLFCLVLKEIE